MRRIIAIAINTFRESIRDKVLYVLLFFALSLIIGSKAIGWISIGQDIKIVKDLSLASISIFGALVAIFIGTNLVYKEIDKRTLYTIISQPLHRYEFVIGKYIGLVILIFCVVALMTIISAIYVWTLGGKINIEYFIASFLILMKLLLVTAMAVLLSTLSSPILGAIMVFCFYVVGHATGVLRELPPTFEGTISKPVLEALYYVIPNFSNFDIRSEVVNDVPVAFSYIVYVTVYSLLYSSFFIYLAILMFQKKDV